MKVLWMGHGGNRYLAEEIFGQLINRNLDYTYEIISEWEPNLSFMGKIDYTKWSLENWHKSYMSADVILCPQNPIQPAKSHVKIITAMSLGKPVLCADHPSYREIIKDKINGIIFKDIDDIVNGLKLYEDKEKRDKIAEMGYKTVVRRFSKNNIVKKFASICSQTLKLPAPPVWYPSKHWSGLEKIGEQREGFKVAVAYAPLQTQYQSYGDFIFVALKEIFGDKLLHFYNVEAINDHKDNVDIVFLVEFNPEWYRINDFKKCVLLAWDTHGHYMYSHLHGLLKHMRASFITGKSDVQRINATGLRNVFWWPESYCKLVHTPAYKEKLERKVAFVGQTDCLIKDSGGLTRLDYVYILLDRYKSDFEVVKDAYGDNYRTEMNRFMVNIDFPIAHNIGTRLFESNAMGIPCVRAKNDAPGFDEFFKNDVNVFEFEPGNIGDLLNKVDFLLNMEDDEYRELSGRLVKYSKYQSYTDRMAYVLNKLGVV